jgi:hypothetical protein
MAINLQKILINATFALLATSGAAFAHDDATLATLKAPHGGQLKVAGGWHLELVQKKDAAANVNALLVYVTDHDGKPVASSGLTGTATILAGKEKQTAALKPDGENRLKGVARYDLNASPKVVVAVSGGGKTEQARFTPAP